MCVSENCKHASFAVLFSTGLAEVHIQEAKSLQRQQCEEGMETDFHNISQHLVSSLCRCYYQ